MSWSQAPEDWGMPGHASRGDEYEAVRDQIKNLTAPGYTTYTPAWTSTGSAPAIGTSAIVAAYRRVNGSDLVWVGFRITFAGATFGTGDYRFSVPVTASGTAQSIAVGQAILIDAGTAARPGTMSFVTSTTLQIICGTAAIGQTAPHTWANTDIIQGSILYEPA